MRHTVVGFRKNLVKTKLPEAITIQDLANRMTERAVDVVRLLMKQGMMLKITDSIDADTAQLVAEEMGHTVRRVAESDVEDGLFDIPDAEDQMVNRAPIVTIMGHVDHGKTSLLDAIRKANVVSGEAGGITQHIGAYQVTSPLGGKITFIDTPGHAAFTQMRARGAKVTDIVILVVAADDGVKPQTVEAISHAKAAGVPLIVAINKIDKPDANPQKVRTELLQYEIQVESLGGETLEIEISAKQRINLDKLLEMIQIQSEMLDLKANPSRPAEGTVIEAKLDKGRGPVPTVLIERGTLKNGDIVVAGSEWGRVRALVNDKNETIATAGPSLPVEVLGFSGTPAAGDRVAVVESEARAREITDYRIRQKREMASAKQSKASGSLSDMFSKLKVQSGKKEFTLVIKGDVQGSVEAIIGSLEKLGNDEVGARVLHSGVGGITESDITLAASTGAVVIGFNVRALKEAREAAERTGVEIRYYNIIYNLVDDVKAAMSGMLAPTLRETFLGNAKMLEIFNVTKVGKVAGCQVIEGRVERGAQVRLVRDAVVIHEGKLSTLKRFKDEVKEVQIGQECGMAFENYQDMRAGDLIECYTVESIKRSL
jgi:translation initiation factor IF-2